MITTVRKWGNSLGLRIPKPFAAEVRIESGSAVEVALRDGALVVKPVSRRTPRLAELLSRVTKANLHEEIAAGGPIGRELW